MENSSITPPAKLNKIPFIAADIVLSFAAVGITLLAEKPLGVWTVAICLGALFAGFLLLIAPYVLEFSLQLQARNEQLEDALEKQALQFDDSMGRWDRLHVDVKAIFESSKLNIAGYEGLLHRFDQRLESLDTRMLEIERVARVFEAGLKAMSERAETLHLQEAQAWEVRLEQHRTAIQEGLNSLTGSSQGLPSQTMKNLETLDAKLAAIQEDLQTLIERASLVQTDSGTEAEASEPWVDPNGRYKTMLDRALGENTQKPDIVVPESANTTKAENTGEIKEFEDPDTSETAGVEDIPELKDDFLDEAIEDTADEAEAGIEEHTDGVDDGFEVDWPEPDTDATNLSSKTSHPEPESKHSALQEPPTLNTKPAIPEFDAEPASITASILIGIGDRIYVRGQGGGLSEDTGVEMEFVNIGSYRWQNESLSEPVTLEFYLNDEIASLEGPITLKPGEHVEFSPDFP